MTQPMDSIQHALDYIEDHLEESLILEAVAEKAFMSLPNLYRVFYSVTGHPLKDYIRKRRISLAAWRLKHTRRSVEEVALLCGFESAASFTKIFKKITGMSPGVYRKTDLHFSFESIRLTEKVRYFEERELSDRFPDVKVIRLSPIMLHALKFAFQTDHVFLYEIMLGTDDVQTPLNDSYDMDFPGGLYAVCSVPADNDGDIQAAWDRLQAEWLPKSVFALGGHTYLEEFMLYGDSVVRMKLHLPIERKQVPDLIEIKPIAPMWVASFRAYGGEAQVEAEKRMLEWSAKTGHPVSGSPYRCYISYNFGVTDPDDDWWEAGLSVPEQAEKENGYGITHYTNITKAATG